VVFYAVALAHADPLPTLDAAVAQLVIPPLLWVVAVRLVLRHWWSGTGSGMSAMDLPGRLLAAVLVSAPLVVFFVPAFAAGLVGRSFRSGLQAAVWTVTAVMPLTYAIWLPEALRRHAIDGALLEGDGQPAPSA
jgi:uncharacterized sodium:solute symporter family permease YidK